MATAAPARPQAAPVHYGGFWIRVVAVIIDAIIIGIANSIIGTVFGLRRAFPVGSANDPVTALAGLFAELGMLILVGEIIRFAYCTLMESSEKQATIGKMVVGLKVVDANTGGRISFAKAAGRHLAKIISGMILCIGYIMVAFTEKKQGLHDMIAGTLVVSAK